MSSSLYTFVRLYWNAYQICQESYGGLESSFQQKVRPDFLDAEAGYRQGARQP